MKKYSVVSLCHALAVVALSLFGVATASVAASRAIVLATTTSVQDSGLLDALIPRFEKESGYVVKTIAVGSGHAMTMGRRGEADVLLVHSPEAQKKFVAEGSGRAGREVMHNDFVIVGPAADPANVRGAMNSAEAFRKIAASRALFLSRNDNSGTHVRETEIWESAAIDPRGQTWYRLASGLGMGQTLFAADERKAYTLADRATYLALKNKLALLILLQGDRKLVNRYYVVEVNAVRWPRVNAAGAREFADFLVSPQARKIIGEYGAATFGEPLFIPDAGTIPEEQAP